MVQRVEYDVYERSDVAERALIVSDEGTDCSGGKWCPRCRLAIAVTQLTSYFELPFDWGDGMLETMTLGLPYKRPWQEADADDVIRRITT